MPASPSLISLCLIGFVCFFASYMRMPILPLFAVSIGADPAEVGLINASFMLTAGLLSIPFGLLSDRIGRRLPVAAGLLALACSSFLVALSRSPLQMAGAYLVFGAGLAAFAPTMMSIIADSAPAGRLAQSYGLYTTAVYSAMTFGPAAGGFIAAHAGLRQVFLISGSILALLFLAVPFLLPIAHAAGHRGSIIAALPSLARNRPLVASLVMTLGSCFGFGMFVTFLPLHAGSIGLGPGRIGVIFAVQALVNALSRLPFGRLGDTSTDRGLLAAAGFALLAAGIAPLGLFTTLLPEAGCAAVIGIGMAIGFTTLGAILADSVQPTLRGLAMGMYNSCIYFGMMMSAAVMGPVVRRAGFGAGFLLGGGVTAGATLVFFLLCRKKA